MIDVLNCVKILAAKRKRLFLYLCILSSDDEYTVYKKRLNLSVHFIIHCEVRL